MTVRLVKEKGTHRISTVESDNKSTIHENAHRETEIGYLMRKHKIKEVTGNDVMNIKRDLKNYDKASERKNDTKYSESQRREQKEKAENIRRKYKW